MNQQILVNQIWQHNSISYRLLYLSNDLELIYWIDINDQNRLPTNIELDEFLELKDKKEITLVENKDDYDDPSSHSEKSINKWTKHCTLVESVKSEEPLIYTNKYFNRRCVELATEHEMSRQSVRRILLKYWKGGSTNLALLPRLVNSGARGKTRASGELKRGRPNIYTDSGPNIDQKLQRIIEKGYKKYYMDVELASLETAYMSFIQVKYPEETKNKKLETVPSSMQFKYWGEKKYSVEERKKAKKGAKIFNKDLRITTESSLINAIGPGSLYQIDSTKSDIELVSSLDSSIPIGSPTLYFVSDVFSRMIAGVLVTLEDPSYFVGARAIYNAIIDKDKFCEMEGLDQYKDLEVTNVNWPCNALPDAIVADRAELLGSQSNNIIRDLGITIENTPAYRPDLKGVVENHFKVLHSRIKGLKKNTGYKSLNHKQRGVRDARKDAVYTLKEYYAIIIAEVINYNNTKPLEKYPLDQEMIKDGVKTIPIKLWNWGIQNRSGQLRSNAIANLKEKLLPKLKGKINKDGLEFKKLWYNIPPHKSITNKQLLLQDKRMTVDVSFDPFNLQRVYLHYSGEMISCEVSKSRSPLAMLNQWELETHLDLIKKDKYDNVKDHRSKSVDTLTFIKGLSAKAEGKKRKKKSKSMKPSKIRENKTIEKDIFRSESDRIQNPEKETKIIAIDSQKGNQDKSGNMDFYRKLMDDE